MGNCSQSPVKPPSATTPSSSGSSKTRSSCCFTTKLSSISSTDNVGCPKELILGDSNHKIFTFAELKSATGNFKLDTVLGEGGFGTVYKGWLDEKTLSPTKYGVGMVVAVKKLKPESKQGLEEWQSEVNFLGRLSHPNLVKLLGYCCEDENLLLVYEFMPKGSLENHLFRRGTAFEALSWSLRLKIVIGAARGLAFLHSSEKQVIYRDIKASNILLDTNYNAKLSDFGIAKHGPTGGDSHVTTRVMGTYGYAAPEYVSTGHLYVKSDVYGFGVVLLEMMSGLRVLDPTRCSEQQNLVVWAKPLLSDRRKLSCLIDQRLEGQYPTKAALQVAQLTLKCLAEEPKCRPSMKEVVETLEQLGSIKVGKIFQFTSIFSIYSQFEKFWSAFSRSQQHAIFCMKKMHICSTSLYCRFPPSIFTADHRRKGIMTQTSHSKSVINSQGFFLLEPFIDRPDYCLHRTLFVLLFWSS